MKLCSAVIASRAAALGVRAFLEERLQARGQGLEFLFRHRVGGSGRRTCVLSAGSRGPGEEAAGVERDVASIGRMVPIQIQQARVAPTAAASEPSRIR